QHQKNHPFLLRIFAEVVRRDAGARLLLVGDGPLRSEVEAQAAALGVADRVVWAGVRLDVPDLMRGVMDVFALPSFYEGVPLVGLEAQAAGPPGVYSDAITDELTLAPELCDRLPLSASPEVWADRLLAHRGFARPIDPTARLIPRFTIEGSTAAVAATYER